MATFGPRTKTPLRREFTGDRQGNQLQENALESARTLNTNPMTPKRGVWLLGKVLAPGKDNVVVHGLGRIPNGYTCIRAKGAAFRAYQTAIDENTITLFQENGFASCTADLWVF